MFDNSMSIEGDHTPQFNAGNSEENGKQNVTGKHQMPELTASSSSECSQLTEKELELAYDVGPFLDTTCGGLEVRIGLVDKELSADLSKTMQVIRSNVTSTAHSVMSSLGLDPQHQEALPANASSVPRSKQDEENQMEWQTYSLNMVRTLLSEKSQELGSSVASNLKSMCSTLLTSQGEVTLFLCTMDQNRNQPDNVERPREVPW